jgi:hypothetical protein
MPTTMFLSQHEYALMMAGLEIFGCVAHRLALLRLACRRIFKGSSRVVRFPHMPS